jgi:hypothetical protein
MREAKMNFMKVFGLAALAAFATVMVVGVGSASAWSLCKTTEFPCEKTKYTTGTTFTGSLKTGTKASFEGGAGAICEASTFDFTLTSQEFNPLYATTNPVSWGLCSTTVTPVHLPWETELIAIRGEGEWEMFFSSSGAGEPGVKIGLCTFTAPKPELRLLDSSVTGGAAEVTGKVLLSSPTCGSLTWKTTYVLSPSEIYSG